MQKLEYIFVVLAMVLLSGGFNYLFRADELDAASGDPILQAIWLVIYIVTTLLIIRRWREIKPVILSDRGVLLLLAIVAMSALWSYAPEVTIRRTLALTGTTLFSCYVYGRYGLARSLDLLAVSFGVIIALSIGFALFLPHLGIAHGIHDGAWQGIFGHKNVLGRTMVLSITLFLLLLLTDHKQKLLCLSGLILSSGLLLLSTSKTGVVGVLIMTCVLAVLWGIRLNARLRSSIIAFGMAGIVLLSTWIASNPGALLEVLGRDETMTGRTELWAVVMTMIWKKWLVGYGYGGFWLGQYSNSADVVAAVSFNATFSHNGILDVWLDLGIIGLSVFLLHFFVIFVKSIATATKGNSYLSAWPFVFLVFTIIYNITESSLLKQNNLLWVLYVMVALDISRRSFKRETSTTSVPDSPSAVSHMPHQAG